MENSVTDTKRKAHATAKVGVVISDRMTKTRVVMVERITQHPMYGKRMRRRKKFTAHDEQNVSKAGDTVRMLRTRPLSKSKRWIITDIVKEGGAIKRQETENGPTEIDAAGSR